MLNSARRCTSRGPYTPTITCHANQRSVHSGLQQDQKHLGAALLNVGRAPRLADHSRGQEQLAAVVTSSSNYNSMIKQGWNSVDNK